MTSRRVVFAVCVLLETGMMWAYPVPTVSIKNLAELADLIIVGRVEHVQQTGVGQIRFRDRTYPRRDFRADVAVDQTGKGDPVPSKFILNYSVPGMDSAGNVAEGGLTSDT